MDTNFLNSRCPPTDQWHVAVLIPAMNEEELLPHCLRSVARARRRLPVGFTSSVVVVSDCSTDRTFALAYSLLRDEGTVLRCEARCVGIARATAASAALELYSGDLGRCWLANTDADCEVPETWLLDHLDLAQSGYKAVAGIVDVQDFSEHSAFVEQRFRMSYRVDADGTHPHVHGANLGVRADAYLLAGGWNDLSSGEDHDLWSRLRSTGAALHSDARLKVLTSGRRAGRAPDGFAQALAAHNYVVTA